MTRQKSLETQTITTAFVNLNDRGGSFVLFSDGYPTRALAWDAGAADVVCVDV